MVKFNSKLKDKWVRALRGKKYKQGKRYLKHKGKYCCLGVLCDVAGVDIKETDNELIQDRNTYSLFLLPEGTQNELAEQNDDGRKFKDIAGFINKHIGAKGQLKGKWNEYYGE